MTPSRDPVGGASARRDSTATGESLGGLPPLDLGEGVLVKGFIHRVDLAPGGEAVVYDYKSSSPAPPDRWLGERNFQIALYMRAVEQLLGAPVAGGFYQPLSGRDLRARGVLAVEEGVVLECVRGDARPPLGGGGAGGGDRRRGAHGCHSGACGATGVAAHHLRVWWQRLHVPVDLPVRIV